MAGEEELYMGDVFEPGLEVGNSALQKLSLTTRAYPGLLRQQGWIRVVPFHVLGVVAKETATVARATVVSSQKLHDNS